MRVKKVGNRFIRKVANNQVQPLPTFSSISGIVPKIHVSMIQLHFLPFNGILNDAIGIVKFPIVIVKLFVHLKRTMAAGPHARLGVRAQFDQSMIIVIGFGHVVRVYQSLVGIVKCKVPFSLQT